MEQKENKRLKIIEQIKNYFDYDLADNNKTIANFGLPLSFRYYNQVADDLFYSDRDYANNLDLFFKHALSPGRYDKQMPDGKIMIYSGLKDMNGNRIFTGDIVVISVLRERYDRNYNTRSKWDGEYLAKAQYVYNSNKQQFEFKLLDGEKERISKLKYGETAERDVNFYSDNLIWNLKRIQEKKEANLITYGKGYKEIYNLNGEKIQTSKYHHCEIIGNIYNCSLEREVEFPYGEYEYGEKTEI